MQTADFCFEIAAAGLLSGVVFWHPAQSVRRRKGSIRTCGIDVKTVVRKKYHVVYAKEGEQIGDLLSLMEAPKARMNFENIRILKDVRNSVNRKVNCEAANLNKTANASLEQVRDIEYISEYYGLESLPENLRQAARLRLEKPDASK